MELDLDAQDAYRGWQEAIKSIRYRKIRDGSEQPVDEAEKLAAWRHWSSQC